MKLRELLALICLYAGPFAAIGWLLLLALLAFGCAPAHADVRVRPFVVLAHGSDLFRGEPFNNRREWSYDHVGAGATFYVGRRLQVDVSQGVKSHNRRPAESGTHVAVRWYPWGAL